MKLTKWFSSKLKPGKKMTGVYPTRFTKMDGTVAVGYSKWYGSMWGYQYNLLFYCIRENGSRGNLMHGAVQYKEWRGMVRKDGN